MSVRALVVYEDGQVGHQELQSEVPVFSRALRVPLASVVALEVAPLSIPRVDYRLVGHAYDGRPIYLADGYGIKEAAISGYVELRGIDKLDEQQRRDVRKFIEREDGCSAIELDEWVGSAAGPHEVDDLQAQCLAKRGVRIKYAIRG